MRRLPGNAPALRGPMATPALRPGATEGIVRSRRSVGPPKAAGGRKTAEKGKVNRSWQGKMQKDIFQGVAGILAR